ncbi:MAG: sulfatase, partial [Candidatus Eisenbacteria bacterium]
MKQKSSTPTKRNRRGSSARRRIILALVPVLLLAILGVWWFGLRSEPRPNIVFISLESVRADHLGAYGYDRPTSPTLDALAREGVIYEDAHAVTSWTLTAHASMFTGLYPGAHQVTGPFDRLDDSYTTVAEALSAQGYQCAGVISGPYLKKAHNLAQGFSHYNESASALSQTLGHSRTNSADVEAGLRHFIDRLRDPRRPFFLFAYFWDPHYDYIPPSPFNRMFVTDDCEPVDVTDYETSSKVSAQCTPGELAYVRSQYDGEIRWTAPHLERFFQWLTATDLWDDTVIIVTADHGEEFFEHDGKGHKNN